MSHHIGLQVLRAKLRGFHGAGASITHRISKSHKERKNRLWMTKRQLGTVCRHHLIAYGLLRNIPYERIERCAENNKPNAEQVLAIIQLHASGWKLATVPKYPGQIVPDLWNIERVKTLLTTPVQTGVIQERVQVVEHKQTANEPTGTPASDMLTPPTLLTKSSSPMPDMPQTLSLEQTPPSTSTGLLGGLKRLLEKRA